MCIIIMCNIELINKMCLHKKERKKKRKKKSSIPQPCTASPRYG